MEHFSGDNKMKRWSYSEPFERLWSTFDTEYGEKGSKPKAFEVFKAKQITEDDVDYIVANYIAQKEAKRQQRLCGEFSADFQHVERYLRNERFEDEIIIASVKLSQADQRKQNALERYLQGSDGESMAGATSVSADTNVRGGRVINFPLLENQSGS